MTYTVDFTPENIGGWGTNLIHLFKWIKDIEENPDILSVEDKMKFLEQHYLSEDGKTPAMCAQTFLLFMIFCYVFQKCPVPPSETTITAIQKMALKAKEAAENDKSYVVEP